MRCRQPVLAAILVALISACASPGLPGAGGVDPEGVALRVSCGGGLAFPIEVLTAPGGAETAADPASEALRRHLATPNMEIDWLPDAGWREAVRTDDSVLFLADDPASDAYVTASVVREGGEWRVSGWSGCQPQVDVGPGLGAASFRVAPTDRLTATTTELEVLVTERACNSGEDASGRVVTPAILLAADTVTVVFAVRPRGGMHTCPSNPETPARLVLPEPLGDRTLLDGSSLPARDATVCPDVAICP